MKMIKNFILYLLVLFCFNVKLFAQDSVVCLHGFLRSFRCMIPMGNALKKEGFNVYLWDYRSRHKRIEEHAKDLVEVLNALAAQNPGQPIHFVTHSLGGVIVRAAVNHPACPKEAKMGKAVLLAPPNKGAQLARELKDITPMRWIFGKKAGLQLLTYQEPEMKQFGQFPSSMKVMVIAGDKPHWITRKWMRVANDGKVTVDETCLDTPHLHYVQHANHTWIMTSRETIQRTKLYFSN